MAHAISSLVQRCRWVAPAVFRFIHRLLFVPSGPGSASIIPMVSAMLRSAVALLLALSCAAAEPAAAVAPAAAEPVTATVPSDDAAAVLAAARSANFFYQNHLKHLADDLNSPDQPTRLLAMSTLGQTQDPEAVVLLVPLLEGGKRLPADLAGACQAAASLGFPEIGRAHV